MTPALVQLEPVSSDDFPRLLQLWESSVRATHHFLSESDIIFFRNMIQEQNMLAHVEINAAKNQEGYILGFLGASAHSIEMLFVDPAVRGMGIGRKLVEHALEKGIRKVDVNEQNIQAVGFYERFGFRTMSRSPLDGGGKPFPLLHMELDDTNILEGGK